MDTPENITELESNEIFVFGSNLAGKHMGGAAALAKEKFGAEEGVGEGMTGQCYAFPTLNLIYGTTCKRPKERMVVSRDRFYECVKINPDKIFLLTRVGCGIAGYDEDIMRGFFKENLPNLVKPKDW